MGQARNYFHKMGGVYFGRTQWPVLLNHSRIRTRSDQIGPAYLRIKWFSSWFLGGIISTYLTLFFYRNLQMWQAKENRMQKCMFCMFRGLILLSLREMHLTHFRCYNSINRFAFVVGPRNSLLYNLVLWLFCATRFSNFFSIAQRSPFVINSNRHVKLRRRDRR